jgi:hypothetical protein
VRQASNVSPRKREQGIVITLVAVVMLFVIGAMAALAIDVVTLYTARSEAQLAADSAALAGARVLANSGMTSDTGALAPGAEALASTIATQVATHNDVGGRALAAGEVTVTINANDITNPRITVATKRTDLPTFFSRIWGNTALTVAASATAEAYNPSGAKALTGTTTPVAPLCVKPWLLPNLDPTSPTTNIFDPVSGAIQNTGLVGWTYNTTAPAGTPMIPASECASGTCTEPFAPKPWNYYPGDQASFPAPTTALPTCSQVPTPTAYQTSIAGCVQMPISCGGPNSASNKSQANIDMTAYGATRNADTAAAVNCLTHATNNKGDTCAFTPGVSLQFVAGADNPIPGLATSDVIVSDSLVTVPVFDVGATFSPTSNTVQIVGFVQLFLNPDGNAAPPSGSINATIINLAGCGTTAAVNPILGNGASPVAVRLITPP